MDPGPTEDRLLYTSDYLRYGRQMILDGFGLEGQIKLQRSSAVVVGAGGLGCPALQYLAAAGVGHIGIIDHDKVELSNLQRQVLHSEQMIGKPKAYSAAEAIRRINSGIQVTTLTEMLSPSNALSLLQPYDVILDCTDNAPTRYLLSDTAVRLGKPLVSGAAQKYEGQLCIYNLGQNGPCYRCIFPKPPAPQAVGTCEETGILGAVTGIIGNMQALEAVKLITGLHDGNATLLLFSAISSPPFRSIKLRARQPTCPACGQQGPKPHIIEGTDYVTFCGGARPNWLEQGLIAGSPGERIRVEDLRREMDLQEQYLLIDVRPRTEFGICHLPGSKSIPLSELLAEPATHIPAIRTTKIFVLCRLGNDSQIAAQVFRDLDPNLNVRDVVGGLRAWSQHIDPQFPIY
ncbi:hypothetical protein BKA82DRAFT_991737 [Pisolithus tinctorius]|uniref:Needs CLA4 to survive protein 3 n=1 Tax=Pisolithus tinctorius Marx 270 TaxID=870435 RepID=A0A0C3PZ28_PISTI|nr:hypothetical protein BKA82DRAFT_991737 [Pisolithus tinctorius]KIO15036.1 hypothetical protein M404DRAFT_991737 [Pisolithus tinctorius Marx 270]